MTDAVPDRDAGTANGHAGAPHADASPADRYSSAAHADIGSPNRHASALACHADAAAVAHCYADLLTNRGHYRHA